MPVEFDPAWEYRVPLEDEEDEKIELMFDYEDIGTKHRISGWRFMKDPRSLPQYTFAKAKRAERELKGSALKTKVCTCGWVIDSRSEQCKECWHKKWNERKVERLVYCACGRQITRHGFYQAKQCRKCYDACRDKLLKQPCKYCGGSFQPLHRGHRYCSRTCANQCSNDKWRGTYRSDKWKPVVCKVCQTHFHTKTDQIYCGKTCSGKDHRTPERPCQTCGNLFHPKSKRQKLCGNKCKTNAGRKVAVLERVCEQCGAKFMPKWRHKGKFCGTKCAATYGTSVRWLKPRELGLQTATASV